MARIIPEATDAELSTWPSAAERRVYRTCSSLPADWLVIHGLRTTAPGPRGALRDGEADFTIFDPDRGLLCIEVKGGAIEYDGRTRKWWGHRRGGQRVWRTDPFNQAMKRKNDLVRAVMGSAAWKEAKAGALPKAHAVLFPDIDDLTPITLPDAPPEIVGGRHHMKDLEGWIDEVWRAWEPRVQRPKPLPDNAMELVEAVLAASFRVEPKLGVRIDSEREAIHYWTDLQWQAMCMWPERSRLAIQGGAGTGKTVLAVRRAQQLADEGKTVALFCFNRPLADFLRLENIRYTRAGGCDRDRIHTMSFEAFGRWWLDEVKRQTGQDHLREARQHYPGRDEHRVLIPLALGWALDEHRPEYDAIIIDEGQDFGEEDWNAIETLAHGRDLAILYDPNQAVFRNASNFPISQAETFSLRKNCRNTAFIHDAAYASYEGPKVDRPQIEGVPVRRWVESTSDRQIERIAEGVAGLLAHEGVQARDIAVLLLDPRRKRSEYSRLEEAMRRHGVPFVVETHGDKSSVLLETAGRFKGLEASVTVLWMNGEPSADEGRKMRYVAQSRACSLLVVVGTDE